MIIFDIFAIFDVVILSFILIAFVGGEFLERRETLKERTEREKRLKEIEKGIEDFERYEKEYGQAKTFREKKVCERGAMKSYADIERSFNLLKKDLVKEVNR